MQWKKPLTISALVLHYSGLAGHEVIYHTIFEKIVKHAQFHYEVYITKNAQNPPKHWIAYFSPKSSFMRRTFECMRLFRQNNHIFFMESFTAREMIAYILAALCSKKKTSYWLLFRDDLIHQGKKAYISLFFLKAFRFMMKKRFTLFSDSDMVMQYFIEKGVTTVCLPNPHAMELEQELKDIPSCNEAPMICWWPGLPRKHKGSQEITHLLSTQESHVATLMLSEAFQLPKTRLSVKRLPATLSRAEYLSYLKMSHFILLPYDPIAYRCRTSGILVEAIMADKIPLVKEGSYLANELRKFQLDDLIVDWQHPLFFSELERLLKNNSVRHKLHTMKKAYHKAHSLENYHSILFRFSIKDLYS